MIQRTLVLLSNVYGVARVTERVRRYRLRTGELMRVWIVRTLTAGGTRGMMSSMWPLISGRNPTPASASELTSGRGDAKIDTRNGAWENRGGESCVKHAESKGVYENK